MATKSGALTPGLELELLGARRRPSRAGAPPGLDRLAIHGTIRRAGQRVGEGHRVRPFEAGDLRADEVDDLLHGVAIGRSHLDDRLDRLAPLDVGDPVDARGPDAVHLDDHRFDLGRIHVLAAGLDQLFFRLAPDVVEPAVLVEAPDVAGVMPAVAQGVGGHVRLAEVALEHARAAPDDLARRAGRHLAVVVVDEPQPAHRNRPAGGTGLVAHALDADEPGGPGLAEAGPELRLRLVVQPLDRGRRVEPRDVLQARQFAA